MQLDIMDKTERIYTVDEEGCTLISFLLLSV
jgi:hypothetical protein